MLTITEKWAIQHPRHQCLRDIQNGRQRGRLGHAVFCHMTGT